MPARRGVITPLTSPVKGETVEDADRGRGVVTRTAKGGTVWVDFGAGEVMFTYRTSLQVWKAFPGPADAVGLRSLV